MYPVFTPPSPLPEGEGTEWGIFGRYADLSPLAESIID
jgi:hypothetical protein